MFSSKIPLLNQVSGFVRQFSKLKCDVINPQNGEFQYYKHGPGVQFLGMVISNLFEVTTERNNFTKKHSWKTITHLFLNIYKWSPYCFNKKELNIQSEEFDT